MGTDIHLAAEVRKDGVWKYVKTFPSYNEDGYSWEDSPDEQLYALFGVLAGVRERIDTGEALFPGRGLPEDIDKDSYDGFNEVYDESKPDLGDHSQTWASFVELATIDSDVYNIVESEFVRWIHGRVADLAKEHGPENARVLMGFDS